MKTVAGTLSGVLWLFVAAGSTRADEIRADAKAREGWKWEFHGAVTFRADLVEHELANEFDVAYALRNEQPDDSTRILELLSQKVTAGYLRQGFPDVKAIATISVRQHRIRRWCPREAKVANEDVVVVVIGVMGLRLPLSRSFARLHEEEVVEVPGHD